LGSRGGDLRGATVTVRFFHVSGGGDPTVRRNRGRAFQALAVVPGRGSGHGDWRTPKGPDVDSGGEVKQDEGLSEIGGRGGGYPGRGPGGGRGPAGGPRGAGPGAAGPKLEMGGDVLGGTDAGGRGRVRRGGAGGGPPSRGGHTRGFNTVFCPTSQAGSPRPRAGFVARGPGPPGVGEGRQCAKAGGRDQAYP